jgi:hypothetical protein
MKQRLLLCSVSLILLSASMAVAKKSPYPNIADASHWSTPAETTAVSTGDYRNILAATKWSSLPKHLIGRANKKVRLTGAVLDDEMFEEARPSWKQCFSTCVGSAMEGAGTMCITNCTACGLVPNPWSCAVCIGCGTVGFAAIEFCALRCCVNPGCPASPVMEQNASD